ncbi:hypothetical protein [Paenibacillus luteus]|uniref:hypothetical protein n=1 Tax=Paenibacillus luteus TaxID=2545753 RepID=UPI001141ADB3|nr:hypothetical protein [Paenibacillus luteus]
MKTKKMMFSLISILAVSAVAVQLTTAYGSSAPTQNKEITAAEAQSYAKKKSGKKPAAAPPAPNQKPSEKTAVKTSSTLTDQNGYTISITGGYETDAVDHGRPVVLIAAALGVPTEVFRKAFSGVTPAGANSDGPTSEEAQANKAALLKVLVPYGITNERLDEVSNYYRYNGSKCEVWTHTAATATTLLTDGVVTGIKITNAGAGYSSNPTIKITGPSGTFTAVATLAFSTDLKTNGSLASITLQ